MSTEDIGPQNTGLEPSKSMSRILPSHPSYADFLHHPAGQTAWVAPVKHDPDFKPPHPVAHPVTFEQQQHREQQVLKNSPGHWSNEPHHPPVRNAKEQAAFDKMIAQAKEDAKPVHDTARNEAYEKSVAYIVASPQWQAMHEQFEKARETTQGGTAHSPGAGTPAPHGPAIIPQGVNPNQVG